MKKMSPTVSLRIAVAALSSVAKSLLVIFVAPFVFGCSWLGPRGATTSSGIQMKYRYIRILLIETSTIHPALPVCNLWSVPAKANGLKNPVRGLTGTGLEDAAESETRDELECFDVSGLVVFPAQDQN